LKAVTLMTNLRLKMVWTMKWLIVMMRLMIWLTRTHMKIIFNRCNAYFIYFASVSKYIFFYLCLFAYS
jgi:hypothetical protein